MLNKKCLEHLGKVKLNMDCYQNDLIIVNNFRFISWAIFGAGGGAR